jgi:hypothetical protein
MKIELFWSDHIKHLSATASDFFQKLANRAIQGHYRYGPPDKRKKYLTRLSMELKEYKKRGNCEQLYNIAVFCWLESLEPENKKFHFDPSVDSVTRGRID